MTLNVPRHIRIGALTALGVLLLVGTVIFATHRGLPENFSGSALGIGLVILIALFAVAVGTAIALSVRHHHSVGAVLTAAQRLADGETLALPATGDNAETGELAIALRRLQQRLQETTVSRDYLDRVLASMQDAIIVTNVEGRITRVNAAACKLMDCDEPGLLGKAIGDLATPSERSMFLHSGPRPHRAETVFRTASGNDVPVAFTWSAIESGDPALNGFIISARDIADRKLAERRIRYLARIDALTKVPNRAQFQHLLQRALAKARRNHERPALLYLDVDRFKDINDTFGHGAGDASLEHLANRVTQMLPDGAFMGRLAGDEFGVLVYPQGPAADRNAWLLNFARQLVRAISEVLLVQGHELYITATIGIASYPSDADNVPDLIRNADAALYHAKRAGGNRIALYRPEMNTAEVERLILKSKLKRSYELDELLLNYQPKIDLRTGRVTGAEALVRWELSAHGLVLPSEFIPLAEETGLILEIGEWVLNRVCADYAEWREHIGHPGIISVNLSLKQLAQPNFARRINRIFKRHGISADCLELEITETTLMQNPDRTIRILRELHEMGLHLAIDDFGTGYSSLSALQKFPIDCLKIDQSFVRNAAVDTDDATIVAAIIDLGHGMNMKVIAEGVESEEQLAFLRAMDCDYVQGLLFGEPMTADAYLTLLRNQLDGNDYRVLFA